MKNLLLEVKGRSEANFLSPTLYCWLRLENEFRLDETILDGDVCTKCNLGSFANAANSGRQCNFQVEPLPLSDYLRMRLIVDGVNVGW